MTTLLRQLIWKELYELARQPWVLAGAFLVPLYLLIVASTFVQRDAPIRVVVSHIEDEWDRNGYHIEALSRMEGIAPIFVRDAQEINLLMARHGATLALILNDEGRPTFVERSATQLERRLNFELAARIAGTMGGTKDWMAAALADYASKGGPALDLRHLSVMPGDDTQIFIPRFLAMITVFLASILTTRTMLRELESRTLPMLLTLPCSSWPLVLGAKLLFVLALTISVIAFLMLILQPMFGFYLRPGLVGFLTMHLVAAFGSCCIGLSLALLGRSTQAAYLSVSVYLIANLVLTGFISSLDDLPTTGGTLLRVFFPLTYLRPVTEGWVFFGDPVSWRSDDCIALAVHAVASLGILAVVAGYRRRQF
ncbi:ABC transporter permease [Sedimentitalea todarodis]|uniref:ABC transporter permease n=1 Tax=Sedimentitalea todarodis TaxID=1631240 RepID=A0ABU3VDV0_9RHOB|nr:ABC transporter permease [Sedimentitalea todarodis]MDU9004362.1 ABC transporter permease [Sedimentitalea todarodis]